MLCVAISDVSYRTSPDLKSEVAPSANGKELQGLDKVLSLSQVRRWKIIERDLTI